MAKKERLNEEATLNNNLGSSTLQMNKSIRKQHEKPNVTKKKKN